MLAVPYYKWINSLCRIYLATSDDNSPIPQIKRSFMDAVLDSPSQITSLHSSEPFPLTQDKKIEDKTVNLPVARKSTVVTPNCKVPSKPNREITTSQYIDRLLCRKTGWKNKSSRKVSVTPKPKVAPVQPFRKPTSTVSKRTDEGSSISEEVSTTSEANNSTAEQIEMDRTMAEELQETYRNEDSGILSLDPNFTSDDDMSTYNWEDSGLGAVDDEDNEESLPDIPADVNEDDNSLIEQTDDEDDNNSNNEESNENQYEEEEEDEFSEEQMTITPVPNPDEDASNNQSSVRNSTRTADEDASNNQSSDRNSTRTVDEDASNNQSSDRNSTNNGDEDDSNNQSSDRNSTRTADEENIYQTLHFPSQTIVPLSIDFMDSLDRLFDDRKSNLYDTFSETKLFDGSGKPLTTESILQDDSKSDPNEKINSQNAVYTDILGLTNLSANIYQDAISSKEKTTNKRPAEPYSCGNKKMRRQNEDTYNEPKKNQVTGTTTKNRRNNSAEDKSRTSEEKSRKSEEASGVKCQRSVNVKHGKKNDDNDEDYIKIVKVVTQPSEDEDLVTIYTEKVNPKKDYTMKPTSAEQNKTTLPNMDNKMKQTIAFGPEKEEERREDIRRKTQQMLDRDVQKYRMALFQKRQANLKMTTPGRFVTFPPYMTSNPKELKPNSLIPAGLQGFGTKLQTFKKNMEAISLEPISNSMKMKKVSAENTSISAPDKNLKNSESIESNQAKFNKINKVLKESSKMQENQSIPSSGTLENAIVCKQNDLKQQPRPDASTKQVQTAVNLGNKDATTTNSNRKNILVTIKNNKIVSHESTKYVEEGETQKNKEEKPIKEKEKTEDKETIESIQKQLKELLQKNKELEAHFLRTDKDKKETLVESTEEKNSKSKVETEAGTNNEYDTDGNENSMEEMDEELNDHSDYPDEYDDEDQDLSVGKILKNSDILAAQPFVY